MTTVKTVSGAGYQRRELGTCLPLATPFGLHIFPSHICNLKCGYCLHSLSTGKIKEMGFRKTLMDFYLFTKCIDDATKFPEPFKVLIFAGWGEPLTHPQIAEMVEYAKSKKIAERIEIVSNGILLTHQLSDKLIDAGLDRIRISIQGIDSERCCDVAGVAVDFDALVSNIQYYHSHRKQAKIFIKTVDIALPTSADQNRFHEIFGKICDEIAIEQVIPVISEIDHSKFGSELKKRHCGGEADDVTVCPFPFYMSVIHPDGNYAPCCCQKRPKNFGTIVEKPITEIWESRELNDFRVAHLKGDRGESKICAACPRPQYDTQQGDNLDSYADKLLPLFCNMHK